VATDSQIEKLLDIARKLRAQPESPQRQAALVTLSGLFHKPEEVVASVACVQRTTDAAER
jgi:hypothetical protein